MIEIKVDTNGFHKRVEKMFQYIDNRVSNPNEYKTIVEKAQKGLRENRETTIKNELIYADMKTDLKQEGYIPEDTPLSVTGQLIDDLYYDTMSKSPDEILGAMTFRAEERMRPTYYSMWQVYHDEIESLDYKASKSSDVMKKLQTRKGWPIIETLYKGYKQDFVKKVSTIVAEAFWKAPRK